MGENTPQRRQDDGWLSLFPILTDRQVGPSRFPHGWQQVANRSRLASRSVARLAERPSRKSATILESRVLLTDFCRGPKSRLLRRSLKTTPCSHPLQISPVSLETCKRLGPRGL